MGRTMIVPELVGDLVSVADGLRRYDDKLDGSGVFAKLTDADPKLADRFAEHSPLVRRAYLRLDSGQPTAEPTKMLVIEGPTLLTGLREHLAAVSEVERFIQRRRLSEAMNSVSVPIEEYGLRLAGVSGAVGRLRPVHVLVQRHCSAVGLEYLVKEGDDAFDEQFYRELKQEFSRPLMDARDAFFQDASAAHLESYVATALELAEQEHPLAAVVEHKSFVKYLPAWSELASSLLESLTVESLMVPVLEV